MTPLVLFLDSIFHILNPLILELEKLMEDQVTDYATRRGISVKEAERWLTPNLSYSPRKQLRFA